MTIWYVTQQEIPLANIRYIRPEVKKLFPSATSEPT
jgi:hypothetical protein